MKCPKQHSLFRGKSPNGRGFLLRKIVKQIIIPTVVISISCPYTYAGSEPHCGDEIQIETLKGTSLRGKLWHNDGNLLILRSDIYLKSFIVSDTLVMSDVAKVFEIKRKTGTGAIIGLIAGTALGAGVGYAVSSNIEREEDDWFGFGQMERQIETGVAITVAGSVVGLAIGAIIGERMQTLKEVEPMALPICFSPSVDGIPMKLAFSINF
jgi:hypothetical protein